MPQNLGVTSQDTIWHCITHVWIQFVPVQTEELQPLAVQEESIQIETRLSKSYPRSIVMQWLVVVKERDYQIIEMRCGHVPEHDVSQVG